MYNIKTWFDSPFSILSYLCEYVYCKPQDISFYIMWTSSHKFWIINLTTSYESESVSLSVVSESLRPHGL